MTDNELLRYSRHILLNEIGIEGQEKIRAARVLVIGAGGLGSPAAFYLASAGVGAIRLVDGDTVDLTNLQRQILHTTDRIGTPKAHSGQAALHAINSDVQVSPTAQRVDGDALSELVEHATIVLDCSDNFATRHAINRACVKHRKPLVSGAAIRFDGQIAVFDLRADESPCYACLFPAGGGGDAATDELCSTMGVFAPLTGIIGTMQAAEALKLAAGIEGTLNGRLMMLDALTMQWHSVRVTRDPACQVCADRSRTQPTSTGI
ncbi:MAG TPA: molybdopterin-synthase adenylyltransferase MoeB [Burkholderiaceae bacterium]|jgi:adenylyltransferase/sulfurtransferase|nr:molybdopterin-synthase adenylyltransferase MoeB [Burkholderiaceae bacterium]